MLLLVALSAHAAELPFAADYEVTQDGLDAKPADMQPPVTERVTHAALAAPSPLAWASLPEGMHDLRNGLAWWLTAPVGARPFPDPEPETTDEPRETTWTRLRAASDAGGMRVITAHDHTTTYGRITTESDTTWTVVYDDRGLATEVWGEGRRGRFPGFREVQTRMVFTWTDARTVASMVQTECVGPALKAPGWSCSQMVVTAAPERAM